MASATKVGYLIFGVFQFLGLLQTGVLCYQNQVGDLDAWGIPTSANPQVYINWSKKHHFQIGDSLLFLYPPSQDSVIQVTEQDFNTCKISEPVLKMGDGNSLFNITAPGKYYFTSGEPGHCEKKQKLEISVLSANGSDSAPSFGPAMLPATSPAYPTVFGSIPSASSAFSSVSASATCTIASAILTLLSCL
ncbi:early nodulin-like protein 8 [Aristolochia californica]|uniref:early nodulin-like protein 8 n=1 Tax=Aristolochia californica TaxID=171875 RepID=UPI0035E2333F